MRLSEIIYRDQCLAFYRCIVEFLIKYFNFDTLFFSLLLYALRILVYLLLNFCNFLNY